MKTEQIIITSPEYIPEKSVFSVVPDLLIIFGEKELFTSALLLDQLDRVFPKAIRFGCSSAGEINALSVKDNSLVVTAIQFKDTRTQMQCVSLDDFSDSRMAGKELIRKFPQKGLKHLMVLSDGLHVNGANLVEGIRESLSGSITVTGGLAGDGTRFRQTYVYDTKGVPREKIVSALGFYGKSLKVGYGSKGGWDSFGKERLVTKSQQNVLYELDHQPALQLYKQFLGEKAKDLPGSGLLFPLSMRETEGHEPVVRTILQINEKDQSLIFAGNIPEGAYVRLMKANVDRLINGAEESAQVSSEMLQKGEVELAVLISCVGRKLVLKQLIEEEVDAVLGIIGEEAQVVGFYSYGEISPFREFSPCVLHNQTMTITTFTEK